MTAMIIFVSPVDRSVDAQRPCLDLKSARSVTQPKSYYFRKATT